ncbi:MAG: hypothetical protein COA86_05515 [Kangiella sp.]|nr:MAG: hypothetical protein COA86_05515 [Kangiella sp.]
MLKYFVINIFLLVSSLANASNMFIDKNNIENIEITPSLIIDGKQIYFLKLNRFSNNKQLGKNLERLTGNSVTSIGKNLIRIILSDNRIKKSLLKEILNLPDVIGLYPNVKLKVTKRGFISEKKELVAIESKLGKSVSFSEYRNDYEYPGQWALENNAQGVGSNTGSVGIDVGAVPAWQLTSGLEDGVVAIFGEKIDLSHEDLVQAIWVNELEIPDNNIDDDSNGYIDDINGINIFDNNGDINTVLLSNTTALAGIISATQDNNIGISGLTSSDKILTCYMLAEGVELSVDDIGQCFTYIIDLKQNRGVNIHSVLLDWGFFATFEEEFSFMRDFVDSLIPFDIFVIAPTRLCDFVCIDIDRFPDIPASYDSPNLIAVTSIGSKNARQSGINISGYSPSIGYRSVHTAAPGATIITTLSGNSPEINKEDALFFSGFDSEELPEWEDVGANFSFSNLEKFEGEGSLSIQSFDDSNATSLDELLVSPTINLLGLRGKDLVFTYRVKFEAEGVGNITYSPVSIDIIYGDNSTEFLGTLDLILTPVWRNQVKQFLPNFGNLPGNEKTDVQLSRVRIRLRNQNVNDSNITIYIDNFSLGIVPENGVSNNYGYFNGTSPAGAHVAASISMIKQFNPQLSMSEIKNLIVSTGSPFDDIANEQLGILKPAVTINNKSLKLASNNSNSMLTCVDQKLVHRVYPKQSGNGAYTRIVGVGEKLAVYNINCKNPAGSPIVRVDGELIQLLDDGKAFDTGLSDGIYTASLISEKLGEQQIEIEGDEYGSLKYRTFSPYNLPTEVDYQWEVPTSSVNDTPFDHYPNIPINIGNIRDDHQLESTPFSFNTLRAGYIIINYLDVENRIPWIAPKNVGTEKIDPQFAYENFKKNERQESFLPILSKQWKIVIAPYLRNAFRIDLGEGTVKDFIIGEAPNRKWVVEWYNRRELACPEQEEQVFQAVFHETKGEIQFNYKSVGESCEVLKPGVGIQIGKHFESIYNETIKDETSVVFKLPNNESIYINQAPQIIQNFANIRNEQSQRSTFVLDEYIYDDAQETLTYKLYYDSNVSEPVEIDGIFIENGVFIIDTNTIVASTSVYLVAEDAEGLKNNLAFFLSITGSRPQRLKLFDDLGLYVREEVLFDLSEYFEDNIDEYLVYTLDLPEEHYEIDGNILKLNFLVAGEFNILITATDSDSLTAVTRWNINSFENNLPYIKKEIGELELISGQSFTIDLKNYFGDIEDSSLFYSAVGLPANVSIANTILSGAPEAIGIFNFTVSARDSRNGITTANGSIKVRLSSSRPSVESGGGSLFFLLALLVFLLLRNQILLKYRS